VELLKGLFNPCFPEDSLRMVAEENLKLPRDHASELLRDTAFGDWRDVIERIELPTLVIGGEASIFPSASQRWISSKISGSKLAMFTEVEGGSHFMFLENPDLFNSKVLSFLAS
jgi:non-heme chloroperoxidase